MSRKILGPFSRVEGHLEIELERTETNVTTARVNSPMFRGMETVMLKRDPMDALTIAPRICGICSVSQSVAAARVLGKLAGVTAPRNGELITNLILACEVLSNHLTHFYLFFMPDFARPHYETKPWFDEALRFKAEKGQACAKALEARNHLLHIMGVLAGKWPHTLTIRPGGTTQSIKTTEKLKLRTILSSMTSFLEGNLFASSINDIVNLKSLSDLRAWQKTTTGDAGFFLKLADDLGLAEMGQTSSTLMSGGGYPVDGVNLFAQGVFNDQQVTPLPISEIREDISHSFMGGPLIQAPFEGVTDPYLDKEHAYSWCKAPRLEECRAEVGALARHVVNAEPLFRDLYQHQTSSVENRIFARLWEMAKLTQTMQGWINEIEPNGDFFEECEFPQDAQAVAFVEAARGTLGHWISVKDNVISNYQIVAPTTWNFSPRDHTGQTGPLEDALENTPIKKDKEDPISVQHIVRSFDPCMACTVH